MGPCVAVDINVIGAAGRVYLAVVVVKVVDDGKALYIVRLICGNQVY